jgi:transcription antitermination factor NusG
MIEIIKSRELQQATNIQPFYRKGQVLKILQGPFAGFDSIYCGMDDQKRVIVLFEFMKKITSTSFSISEIALSS